MEGSLGSLWNPFFLAERSVGLNSAWMWESLPWQNKKLAQEGAVSRPIYVRTKQPPSTPFSWNPRFSRLPISTIDIDYRALALSVSLASSCKVSLSFFLQ